MEIEQQKMVEQIFARWHHDIQAGSSLTAQAIFDIGFLFGLVARLEDERKELLLRLHEATQPD